MCLPCQTFAFENEGYNIERTRFWRGYNEIEARNVAETILDLLAYRWFRGERVEDVQRRVGW